MSSALIVFLGMFLLVSCALALYVHRRIMTHEQREANPLFGSFRTHRNEHRNPIAAQQIITHNPSDQKILEAQRSRNAQPAELAVVRPSFNVKPLDKVYQ